jgi:heme oxygenase
MTDVAGAADVHRGSSVGCGAHARGTLRRRLRAATAATHAALDECFSRLDLRRRGDYGHFLQASAAALLPLEAVLVESGVGQVLTDWPLRARSDAIVTDIVRLGGRVDPLPPPARLSRYGALGTLYVLEGSRLGAKVLLRTVESSLDPVVAGAAAYLSHGAGRRLWPSFLAVLEREAPSPAEAAEAIAAARQAFDLFARATARDRGAGSERAGA